MKNKLARKVYNAPIFPKSKKAAKKAKKVSFIYPTNSKKTRPLPENSVLYPSIISVGASAVSDGVILISIEQIRKRQKALIGRDKNAKLTLYPAKESAPE